MTNHPPCFGVLDKPPWTCLISSSVLYGPCTRHQTQFQLIFFFLQACHPTLFRRKPCHVVPRMGQRTFPVKVLLQRTTSLPFTGKNGQTVNSVSNTCLNSKYGSVDCNVHNILNLQARYQVRICFCMHKRSYTIFVNISFVSFSANENKR